MLARFQSTTRLRCLHARKFTVYPVTLPSRYEQVYSEATRDPLTFWATQAENLTWLKKWDKVRDDSNPPFYKWFAGGQLNTCYNALDRHVDAGLGKQLALIHDSPLTLSKRHFTYTELREEVGKFARVLSNQGVVKGDRVLIYMPMIPEAVVAMLACARLGAIHSVVFGGFAAKELAARINDAQPKVVVSATCGVEPHAIVRYKPMLDDAIEMSQYKPLKTVIVKRTLDSSLPQLNGSNGSIDSHMIVGRDIDYHEAMSQVKSGHDCVPVDASDPLYILYTSGTTGAPKGVVRDNGGHAVALKWTMEHVFGMQKSDTWWAASDIGWVVGHSFIVYGPLLHGNTTVMYEGKPVGTPDAGAIWRVVKEHNVKSMFIAPTALRAVKKEDPEGLLLNRYKNSVGRIGALRSLFVAGERCDPNTIHWIGEHLNLPILDNWWQTETGWPMASNYMGLGLLPIKPGSACKPVPGWDVQVVDEGGHPEAVGKMGSIVCKLPLPPGTMTSLWNNDNAFKEKYFSQHPGFYTTGDAGYVDQDGYVYVMTRLDDVINVAGHRISTGSIEEVIAMHPRVAECAVIGVVDNLKGEVPIGLVVLKDSNQSECNGVPREIVSLVRKNIGPVAAFKTVVIVQALPKTRSGKILRGVMKKIADGIEYKFPATIDDPNVLSAIAKALKDAGFTKRSELDFGDDSR